MKSVRRNLTNPLINGIILYTGNKERNGPAKAYASVAAGSSWRIIYENAF